MALFDAIMNAIIIAVLLLVPVGLLAILSDLRTIRRQLTEMSENMLESKRQNAGIALQLQTIVSMISRVISSRVS